MTEAGHKARLAAGLSDSFAITSGPRKKQRLYVNDVNGQMVLQDGYGFLVDTRTYRELGRQYDVDSPLWRWLRAHGFKRPSPSGPSGKTPESKRSRKLRSLRLLPEAIRRLEARAEREGKTVSQLIEDWMFVDG
jgi:hypothetical protein